MNHTVMLSCETPASFAVDAVRGMFDLPSAKSADVEFAVELPDETDQWQIGVIVGPSGSGKSSVARHAYGKRFVENFRWDKKKAVVDHFPGVSVKDVTAMLTAVGFSSPPSWVKPHHVLSGGERFRCDLARSLLAPGDKSGSNIVAFDEFTSVVDRTVAKIGSAAIAKSIRKGRIGKRFVAVTCHYDVLEWLEPDWVLDMASCQLARGRLWRRPKIELTVAPVHRGAWQLFRRHHYLSHELLASAKCFAAFWDQPDGTSEPVAFSSWIHRMTRKRCAHDMREHRTVVLPDYQGVGIGNRLSEICAAMFKGLGGRAFSTTSHPGMMHYRQTSPLWNTVRFGMAAPSGASGLLSRRIAAGTSTPMERARMQTQKTTGRRALDSAGRVTAGFQYVGPGMDRQAAEAMLAATPQVFGDDACERVLAAVPAGGGLRGAASIARRAGLTREAADRAIAKLLRSGELQRERVGHRCGYVAVR
jgi:GNAT superfamily N-acetyltransferase